MSTCETCRHSEDPQPTANDAVKGQAKRLVCRRYPPTMSFLIVPRQRSALQPELVPVEEQRSGFPVVMPSWACGEWAPKEALIS